MAYQQLSVATVGNPNDLFTRVTNLETDTQANELPGVLGTHIYAGEFVPQTTTAGTDTAGIATQLWVGELRVWKNVSLTGLSYLIGSTGGTDKVIVALYSSAGVLLANSALAGATVGTTATMQRVAFTTLYPAGPGLYYVVVSTNGTTAKIRTQAFGDTNAGVITGQVFGTLPATITVPTTFTASSAAVVMSY